MRRVVSWEFADVSGVPAAVSIPHYSVIFGWIVSVQSVDSPNAIYQSGR